MPDDSPVRDKTKPIAAWFLGPKAENAEIEEKLMNFILQDYFHWRRNYYPSDEIVIPQSLRRELVDWNDDLAQKLAEMLAGLRKHFPFYSPRYMAHMVSDQTLPSVLGYFAGLLYNPNNVTPEAAPVRSEEHTSELQSHLNLVCRLLLEKKKYKPNVMSRPNRFLWLLTSTWNGSRTKN